MATGMSNRVIDLASKLREADVYYSMGLREECLGIYEHLLSKVPDLTSVDEQAIRGKILRIKDEIHDQSRNGPLGMSSGDLSIIKTAVSAQGSFTEMLESAVALKELGLIDEAIAEFERMVRLEGLPPDILPDMVSCYLEKLRPEEAVESIESLYKERGPDNRQWARFKFALGLVVEKRGHKELALGLFEDASSLDRDNEEIREKLNAVRPVSTLGSRYDHLLNEELVTADQLQKALHISRKLKKSVETVLIEQFKVPKSQVGKSLSLYYRRPFKSFDEHMPIPIELISNLKKSFLLHDVWVPLSWGKQGVDILVDDPKDLRKTDQIRGLIKTKNIALSVGIKEDIERFITHFFEKQQVAPVADMIEELDMIPDISFEEEEEYTEPEDIHDEASSQVVRLVDQVLVTAYRQNASDIHIEPSVVTKTTGIRFRMDGVCQEYLQAPNSMAKGILSRLKIMSGLDIAERRLPQDGKIKFKRRGIPEFELRLATIPTAGGFEDAVLRILAKAGAMKLEQMGLIERNMSVLLNILSQPYGIVLVVGPTGSGKTTTLHAALGHINKPGIKIWTAEDPVEITQKGLRQVEVKSKIGLDFARVMRSFLRADPDVIMIGEMRDNETASTGIEASLTGHLVFSTLHTNSAPETVTRLLDMGLNPLNFSDAFLGVLAQRLVRRLCSNCKEPYHPSEEEFDELVGEYGREAFEAGDFTHYGPDLTLYRAKGCEVCSGSGYKGRMGIHELMEGTAEIKRMIKKQVSSDALFAQAAVEGMTTLKQDGIQKIFSGVTDIGEIRRVCIG